MQPNRVARGRRVIRVNEPMRRENATLRGTEGDLALSGSTQQRQRL
jgi:hypothetical protein